MADDVLRPETGAGKRSTRIRDGKFTRACQRCRLRKPADRFGPPVYPGKTADHTCLDCRAAVGSRASMPRKCGTCHETKPRERFGPPVRPGRSVDDLCLDCRGLGRERHTRDDGPCRKCGAEVIRDSAGERKCPVCFAARKKDERRRAAERAGKGYMPGVPFWEAGRKSRHGLERWQAADATWRRLEIQNGRQAWEWWLDHAPGRWLAERRAFLRRRAREAREGALLASRLKDMRRRATFVVDDVAAMTAAAEREILRSSCPYCAAGLSPATVHLDHMDPLGGGGEHSVSNLVGCCAPCNQRKGALAFADWLGRLHEPHRTRARLFYAERFADSDRLAA